MSRGKIASVYLAHGKPHNEDRDLEVYANRPFEQLFETLDLVHPKLQPLWDAVPEPFAEPRKLGAKNNMSPGKIKKIKRLSINGMSAPKIAEELSVHVTTVRRHIPNFVKRKRGSEQ